MLAKVVTISVQPNIMSAPNDRYLDDAQNCAEARKKINTQPSAPKSGKARHENRIYVGFDRCVNGVRNTQPPDPIVETRPVNRAPVATAKLQIENNRAESRRAIRVRVSVIDNQIARSREETSCDDRRNGFSNTPSQPRKCGQQRRCRERVEHVQVGELASQALCHGTFRCCRTLRQAMDFSAHSPALSTR
jgi:hypothetical protein